MVDGLDASKMPPASKDQIKEQLAYAAAGVTILNGFAAIENYWSNWKDPTFDVMFRPEVKQKFLAYRHIRNSFAHFPDGGRAMQRQDEVAAFECGAGKADTR